FGAGAARVARVPRRRLLAGACAAGAAVCIAALTGLVWLRCGPIPAELLEDARARSTTGVDPHGGGLYEARAADGTRMAELRADALPSTLVAATLAAEDHRFWSHVGIDPLALARAVRRHLLWQSREGGSTITQQVAKLLLGRHESDASRTRGW